MLECVINISEGRDLALVAEIGASAGDALLDIHSDPDHHRSVLTVVGEDAPRAIARATVAHLDLREHVGAHPRLGALDVVPFVALDGSTPDDARRARDSFASWIADELGVPAFLYGPERTLPELRRGAWVEFGPDTGPSAPHPTAGAVAVGMRPVLVAWNLWLADADLDTARRIASAIRGPGVRALGLQVGDHVQVSMNLIDPLTVGPATVYDRVASMAPIARAELVGLVPDEVVAVVAPERRAQLDVTVERTIGARLASRRRN